MNLQHIKIISENFNITAKQVENVVALFIKGATIPFISRYRKEMTGNLDEVQIAKIKESSEKLEELEKRRESIILTIEKQGSIPHGIPCFCKSGTIKIFM